MKLTKMTFCAALLSAGTALGQQALKTDTAGNPLTLLNLGGGNVTGTLAAARLPAGWPAPNVQPVTASVGPFAIAPGTTVALLTVRLAGELDLTLPAASGYPAGSALAVVDPGGFSTVQTCVTFAAGGQDTLHGNPLVLSQAGSAVFYSDGAGGWTGDANEHPGNKGQPGGYAGLDANGGLTLGGALTAPANAAHTVGGVTVRNQVVSSLGGGLQLTEPGGAALLLPGDGTAQLEGTLINLTRPLAFNGQAVLDANALSFGGSQIVAADGSLYVSGGARWFDGQGNVTLAGPGGAAGTLRTSAGQTVVDGPGNLASQGTLTLLPVDPSTVHTPAAGAVHYVSAADGREYVRDAAGEDHALW